MRLRRIAVAGFQHETNTFAPTRAGMAEFRMSDSWPELLQGQDVIVNTLGMNLPIAGAIAAAKEAGTVELIPMLWCSAEPSGPVTDAAFDQISDMILTALDEAGAFDAIYLDLHGAMVTESHHDGEAELLARIRHRVGSDMPIGISLDLHANISAQLVELASFITIYRSYPHLDMAETGARCVSGLLRLLNGHRMLVAFRQVPFLVPLHAQYTGAEPCRSLYALLGAMSASPDETIELAMGFTAADIPDCGPSIVTYATSQDRAEDLAGHLFERFNACEEDFQTPLWDPETAVRAAMEMGPGPVILADVQDNPGAGASSDTTGLLRALVNCGADNAMLGVMHDPEIAARAHIAGERALITGALGGRSGIGADGPFDFRFTVRALSDGCIPFTGEMYGGGVADIGPSCLLALDDVAGEILVVVSTKRTQCLDRALFTHFGVDPAEAAIVCVKSTVHFRADFEPGSTAVLNVAAPGLFPCRLDLLTYKNLRSELRQAKSKDAS
ncbi:MAG: M81 family metallopeptidase [Pseudomonadota bacterium]